MKKSRKEVLGRRLLSFYGCWLDEASRDVRFLSDPWRDRVGLSWHKFLMPFNGWNKLLFHDLTDSLSAISDTWMLNLSLIEFESLDDLDIQLTLLGANHD